VRHTVDSLISRRTLVTGAAAAGLLLAPGAASAAGAAPAADDRHGPGAARRRGTAGECWARARLRELERAYAGRIGAYALDTATGATVTHRAHERFPLLSTFKLLAAAAILHTARRRDPGLLDRVIYWTEADLVPYSPVTAQHVRTGLPVARVCEAAVSVSDNTAGNLMLRLLGGPGGLTRFARRLGDPVTRLDRWEVALNDWHPGERRDTTTPAAMACDVHRLLVRGGLARPDRRRLTGWLVGSTTGGARIRAGLPAHWTVGDKTGSSQSHGAANDVAIAWPPGAPPLVLAVYTNRDDPRAPYDNAVIAQTATVLATALRAPDHTSVRPLAP